MSRKIRKAVILSAWILVWEIFARWIGNEIFIVGPIDAAEAFVRNLFETEFLKAAGNSFLKICAGFFGAFVLGILFAAAARRFWILGEILEPVVSLMKTVPVASVVILLLIWTTSKNLSVAISFAVTFPAIYFQTGEGLRSVDAKLLEMAQVYDISAWRKLWYLYRPAVLPYLAGSCRAAVGMAWKSGIAAEVIGVPDHTIGERLYMAKIYLETADLFAWTAAVLILSAVFETVIFWILKRIAGKETSV